MLLIIFSGIKILGFITPHKAGLLISSTINISIFLFIFNKLNIFLEK